jgi:glycerol uptake facilitator-like aquaporin
MTQKDLISTIQLILGLLLVTILLVLMRRVKIKPELWPPALGIGFGVYVFVALMIESIIVRPAADFGDYIFTNLLSAIGFGILGYVGGHILVRNAQKKRK